MVTARIAIPVNAQHTINVLDVDINSKKSNIDMRTIVCNSLQSFWDMADNQFLEGLDVHCVFPVSENLKEFILNCQAKYKINHISFTRAFLSKES
ncbi:hypothetical protein VAT7223_01050 [Vibrio atlanticus]|uniref:Uncharacterized protein n=4 Tax=Vibrio TaxID=662 RepID=A0A1C3ILG0_9VIBR|nr:hypothetical protein VAT7223_01050 [Vibrio atlanticus]